MKFAILINGHVRHSLEHNNLLKIIEEIRKKGNCDLYGVISNKKEHSTKTWYNTDEQLKNETITYDLINNFIKFEKLHIYEEIKYNDNEINNLWGKSPVSYIAIKNFYTNLQKCINMIENNYDIFFKLRFDYYKFNYANYTDHIIDVIRNTDFNNYNKLTAVKVKNARGEDSFFFSNQKDFIKVIYYINNNFDYLNTYAKNAHFYFMPEDLIKYSCATQQILFEDK